MELYLQDVLRRLLVHDTLFFSIYWIIFDSYGPYFLVFSGCRISNILPHDKEPQLLAQKTWSASVQYHLASVTETENLENWGRCLGIPVILLTWKWEISKPGPRAITVWWRRVWYLYNKYCIFLECLQLLIRGDFLLPSFSPSSDGSKPWR